MRQVGPSNSCARWKVWLSFYSGCEWLICAPSLSLNHSGDCLVCEDDQSVPRREGNRFSDQFCLRWSMFCTKIEHSESMPRYGHCIISTNWLEQSQSLTGCGVAIVQSGGKITCARDILETTWLNALCKQDSRGRTDLHMDHKWANNQPSGLDWNEWEKQDVKAPPWLTCVWSSLVIAAFSPISIAGFHHIAWTGPQHRAGLPLGAISNHNDLGPVWHYHLPHKVVCKLRHRDGLVMNRACIDMINDRNVFCWCAEALTSQHAILFVVAAIVINNNVIIHNNFINS